MSGSDLALDGAATLCEAFQHSVREHGDAPALRRFGDETAMTWAQYGERVEQLAGALADRGVGHGDTVAMLTSNRPETHVIDAAAMHLGAIPFNLYTTSSPDQLEYLLGHAEAKVLVVEAALHDRVAGIVDGLEHLEHVYVLDGEADGAQPFEELAAAPAAQGFDFEAAWRAVEGDDMVTLIYTSGTTGPPKGVELTHANLLSTLRGSHAIVPYEPSGRLMSYLPMAHLADRMVAHYPAMASAASVTTLDDPKRLGEALVDVRPTTFVGVPRIWEKMKAGLEAKLPPEVLEQADPEVLAGVRASLGLDQARSLVSGAAPIAPEVLEFFGTLGLPIIEVWGQTETSAAGTSNHPDDIRVGTVGRATPGFEVKLAEDGELLVRGPGTMRGYRKEPEKTAETLDADGWIHTGDIGEIDDDGFIRIVDRKKELIINAAGKNMSPANIENVVKAACPIVGSAVAIGDRRPYVTALLVLDPDAAGAFAREHGLDGASVADLASDERVRGALEEGIERANERLSRVEQIKRFEVLAEEWAPGGDELTPTMKLKRKAIAEKYGDEIDGLYA